MALASRVSWMRSHAASARAVAPAPLHRASTLPTRLARAPRPTVCQRGGRGYGGDQRSPGGGLPQQNMLKLRMFGAELSVPRDSLWMYALPAMLLLGSAAFIGPLVIALAATALALGAAFSAGALAFTALLFPLGILMGLGGLFTLGPLVFLGGGLLLGWGGVNWMLAQQQAAAGAAGTRSDDSMSFDLPPGSNSWQAASGPAERRQAAEEEAAQAQAAEELREFDRILQQKQRAKADEEEWRQGRGL